MPARTDAFDLGRLRMSAGEGRRLELETAVDAFSFGGQRYEVEPARVAVTLDISRTTGSGYALRLEFAAGIEGPCMRCLAVADQRIEVEAREVDVPGGGEELASPYVSDQVLDLSAWARDALALALPPQILCRPECAGLCAVCGEDLNTAGPEHAHERAPDPRWAALRELELE